MTSGADIKDNLVIVGAIAFVCTFLLPAQFVIFYSSGFLLVCFFCFMGEKRCDETWLATKRPTPAQIANSAPKPDAVATKAKNKPRGVPKQSPALVRSSLPPTAKLSKAALVSTVEKAPTPANATLSTLALAQADLDLPKTPRAAELDTPKPATAAEPEPVARTTVLLSSKHDSLAERAELAAYGLPVTQPGGFQPPPGLKAPSGLVQPPSGREASPGLEQPTELLPISLPIKCEADMASKSSCSTMDGESEGDSAEDERCNTPKLSVTAKPFIPLRNRGSIDFCLDGPWRDWRGVVRTIEGKYMYCAHPVEGLVGTELVFQSGMHGALVQMEFFGLRMSGVINANTTEIHWDGGDVWRRVDDNCGPMVPKQLPPSPQLPPALPPAAQVTPPPPMAPPALAQLTPPALLNEIRSIPPEVLLRHVSELGVAINQQIECILADMLQQRDSYLKKKNELHTEASS